MTEHKFREYISSSGRLFLAGKSAKNNEDLVGQVEKSETVLHTKKPGSPFVNIKGKERVLKKDILEAAIFCAKYSQDWRDNHSDVEVHVFKGSNIHKGKGMKVGTFGVKKFDLVKVKKSDILKL